MTSPERLIVYPLLLILGAGVFLGWLPFRSATADGPKDATYRTVTAQAFVLVDAKGNRLSVIGPDPWFEKPSRPADTREGWWSRVMKLRAGMTLAQAQRLLPPMEEHGGMGVVDGRVWLYPVSEHWMVTLGFFGSGLGSVRLERIDADPADDGSAEVIAHVVERLFRRDQWLEVGSIVVMSDGTYKWSRTTYGEDLQRGLTEGGTLPPEIHEAIRAEFEKSSDPYVLGLEDTRTKHPDAVVRVRRYLRATHPYMP